MSRNRRDFLKTAAAGAAATGALSLSAKSYAQVQGANERIGLAFLGVGGRCQQHIDIILDLQRQNRNSVAPVAVCDVWDGNARLGRRPDGGFNGRGLFPSARRCGLNAEIGQHVTKDYRRLLELREVDAVCIAAPDHWHAKMTIDAAAAGKHIYCEKPMTKTIDEAHAVVDAVTRHRRVMTVGVQWMADPALRSANAMIRHGDIGHVAQAQTSYYRNSLVGQWRYYPLTEDMNPRTIDWNMFLGTQFSVMPGVPLAPRMPFDRAIFAQWRCYWNFGGGMYTDLFVHRTTRMISAMGVRYPARVVGAGGIFLEYDGRDVPDVATIVADYDEGCQLLITATMINDHPVEECIRGRLATLKFGSRTRMERDRRITDWGYEVIPQTAANAPTRPGQEARQSRFVGGGISEGEATKPLWLNFLECCRTNNRNTMSTPELGAAAFTTVNMGVLSYRQGQALFWDKERRRPVPADASWAQRWERRSHERGRPNQIIGWDGGTRGSTLSPPEYMRLAGPWNNGQDPATRESE
ncbi:MAG TPA: Gfo/Idh/MocA family oxidoreductase [Gemmataceae bacterium]|nr:Gfo/Idh/MocA family oxidoreductase [Gemmataceae bacterium]